MAKYLPEMKQLMEKRLNCMLSKISRRLSAQLPASNVAASFLTWIYFFNFQHVYQSLLWFIHPFFSFLCVDGFRHVAVGLNGNRNVEGTLRGYDQFMNIVLDDCVEIKASGERRPIGMSVIRGNSIITMETLIKRP